MKKMKILRGATGMLLFFGAMVFLMMSTHFVIAQTAVSTDQSIQGIAFPVQELGNCSNEGNCRAYCNDTLHMSQCIDFAKQHGLMNKDQADRAQGFAKTLQSSGGPKGCKSPTDCEKVCSQLENLDKCIAFAEGQGIKDEHIDQAKKILKHIRSGEKAPGGCTSRETCQTYCSDFSHTKECYEFAQAVGIKQENGNTTSGLDPQQNNPTPDQLQKLADLAATGQTPGGCKSKDACETYCSDSKNKDECVAFGVKTGFIKPEQADMIKKSGNNGPGGCNSSNTCRSYCNGATHRDECFAFAEEHGFSSHDEIAQVKDGLTRLRTGLEQAPPEVAECLKSTVGQDALNDIQAGKLVPRSEVGQSVRSCFEKFGKHGDALEPFKESKNSLGQLL